MVENKNFLKPIQKNDKVLCDKEFNIAKYPKYDGIKVDLFQRFKKFLIKNLSVEQLKKKLFLIKN